MTLTILGSCARAVDCSSRPRSTRRNHSLSLTSCLWNCTRAPVRGAVRGPASCQQCLLSLNTKELGAQCGDIPCTNQAHHPQSTLAGGLQWHLASRKAVPNAQRRPSSSPTAQCTLSSQRLQGPGNKAWRSTHSVHPRSTLGPSAQGRDLPFSQGALSL